MDATAPQRSKQAIQHHYEVEKKLASKLLKANKVERKDLYSEAYNELFETVKDHPQLTKKASASERSQELNYLKGFLQDHLKKGGTYMEIGAGDCALSFAVSPLFDKVLAIDVSETISSHEATPQNFELIISDGCNIPVPPASVDIAFSNQLMEHLHPEDAQEQLENIYRAVRPGGCYVCITPSRLTGPHDISKHFDDIAQGFHLKEYTVGELHALFKNAGFTRIYNQVGAKGMFFMVPAKLVSAFEKILSALPKSISKRLCKSDLVEAFIYPRIHAFK